MKEVLMFLLLVGGLMNAQKERIQIKGSIYSEANKPLEGVTVFNQASLEGTVTNKEGGFLIHAREEDRLSFKAVQLESFALRITKKVMEDKKVVISLEEGINQLDEVIIEDGLMRVKVKQILYVDTKVDKVSDLNLKTRAVDRMENTFSDRIKQPEEYAVRNEAFNQNMPRINMANIIGGLALLAAGAAINELAATTIENGIDTAPNVRRQKFDVHVLKNTYSTEYLLDYLQLLPEDLYEFMYFAKDNGLNESLFETERELDLLQFLSNQVTLFKEKKNYSKITEGFSPSIKEKSNEK
ncbi:MAG: carboxypeptidase-like regulatory domain-containing protein [Nonlabens sp.]|jgi:hypothetical protein|uniref:carboxypeptidase-like regulatory domain-containing protein n=1 Tax=Nonlabens sp. TaxID=1888209 RepID=UPI0035A6E676